jgi:CheY-like chemotaxis protein
MLDPVQLDQVLLNLSINARDAMAGAGRLDVTVRRADAAQAVCASCRQRFGGDYVELAVSDSGPGIPAPVLARMFEPFFTTKQAGRGSGMGLATVHGIVHEHSGHILVDSSAGGSRFRILLPALDGAAAASLPRTGQPAGKARAQLRGRVLVVDDEPSVRGFMREMLQGWGLETTIAASPAQALEAFDADPARWDLVITDQTMPGMTGLALARELLARRADLPVILYSGHLDPVAQRELESAGVRELLAKPVEPALLHILLKRHLS